MSNPDEKVRHYNPVTLVCEYVTPAYGVAVGLIRWDGETCETEIDKTDVEVAVLSVAEATRDDLIERAVALGVEVKKNWSKAKIEAAIEAAAPVVEQEAVFTGDPVVLENSAAPEDLHGDPAAEETK